MNKYEIKWEKRDLQRKLDENSLNIKLCVAIFVMLVCLSLSAKPFLTLCGFNTSELICGCVIVYVSTAVGIPGFIRKMRKYLKEKN